MSENIVAVCLAGAILVALALWAPLLHTVCPPCSKLLRTRLRREVQVAEPVQATEQERTA